MDYPAGNSLESARGGPRISRRTMACRSVSGEERLCLMEVEKSARVEADVSEGETATPDEAKRLARSRISVETTVDLAGPSDFCGTGGTGGVVGDSSNGRTTWGFGGGGGGASSIGIPRASKNRRISSGGAGLGSKRPSGAASIPGSGGGSRSIPGWGASCMPLRFFLCSAERWISQLIKLIAPITKSRTNCSIQERRVVRPAGEAPAGKCARDYFIPVLALSAPEMASRMEVSALMFLRR